jgi:REP element-mobilizing transposase RayT
MANTYTQIHIQLVFAVQNRQSLISKDWKDELYRYITGIVHNRQHKILAINGMPDHLHLLIGLRPIQSLSELVQEIKGWSSRWVNEKKLVKGKFEWQEGYGAFSYGKSQVDTVVRYIQQQEEHHRTRTFREEYLALLDLFGVDYDEKYIFKPLE